MPETTPLIKAALNLSVGAGFDVYVHSVSSGMVMLTDGTELGVTRGYRKELTKKHIAFVQGGM